MKTHRGWLASGAARLCMTWSLVLAGAGVGAFGGCAATKNGDGGSGPGLVDDASGPRDEAGRPLDGGAPVDGSGGDGGFHPDGVAPTDALPPDASPTDVLQIAPADTVITLVGGAPATRTFAAKLVAADGTTTDVTGATTFTLEDATLGTFAAATLTATKAGATTIRAHVGGYGASTPLTIVGPAIVVTPGTPPDAPTKFGGAADPSLAPKLVYPSDGTLVPPNMNVFEFHFLPSGGTLFELAFSSATVDTKVYFTCTALGAGCVYTPDEKVWKLVAEGGRGADAVSYTLRGVDASGKVGTSAAQKISFGLEDIVGGLYYWNAGAGVTMRYEFGVSGKTGERYMDAPTAGAGTCVGCHVISRRGHRIAIGMDIPSPAPYKVFDVATKAQIFAQGTTFGGGSNFFSFSPDESKLLSSNGASIVMRDAKTGDPLIDPVVAVGAMPDWSPDGSKAVYAKEGVVPPCFGGFCGAPGVDQASLETIPWDGTAWGTPTTLVAYGGVNNFYPSFSPDAGWVVFNRSPSNANSFDAKDAEVWVVAAKGGAPTKLATASTGGDSWPKWSPAVQAYKGGSLMWMTFSSRRNYGLRLTDGKTAQLWMTAFDPARAAAGADPSTPGFWLPFQDLGSGNHIAQWVTKVDRKPCTADAECNGEKCVDGICKPIIK